MTCDEILGRLDGYADGELGGAEARSVAEHLGSCLPCRRELEARRELARRTRALPDEIEPARDLWPGIAGRIAASRRAPSERGRFSARPRWVELAAAAALVGAIAVPWLARRAAREAPVAPPAAAATARDPATPLRAALAYSEDGVLQTRKDLSVALESGRERMGDETYADVEENLYVLEAAIAELRAALERDPMNGRLNHSLAAKYRMERELLSRVSRI